MSKKALKIAFIYLLVSIFCAFFGGVYEHFGHGVFSFYMLYAFGFPLVGGALPFFAMGLFNFKKFPSQSARNFHHCGIATLTVGSLIRGVLDIYGTTSVLSSVYWYIGPILILSGIVIYVFSIVKKKN